MRNDKDMSVKGTNNYGLRNMALAFVPFTSAYFFVVLFSHLLMRKCSLSRREESKKNCLLICLMVHYSLIDGRTTREKKWQTEVEREKERGIVVWTR
jgi:hypothetical protein